MLRRGETLSGSMAFDTLDLVGWWHQHVCAVLDSAACADDSQLPAQATPANWPNNHEGIGAKGWAFLLPTVTPQDAETVRSATAAGRRCAARCACGMPSIALMILEGTHSKTFNRSLFFGNTAVSNQVLWKGNYLDAIFWRGLLTRTGSRPRLCPRVQDKCRATQLTPYALPALQSLGAT